MPSNSPKFIAASLAAPILPIAIVIAFIFYDAVFGEPDPDGYDAYLKGYAAIVQAAPIFYAISAAATFVICRVLFMLGRLSRVAIGLTMLPVCSAVSVLFGVAIGRGEGTLQGLAAGVFLFAILGGLSALGVWVWWQIAHRA